ncbi:MAG: SDR family oxidoreductase [Dehalococcoidia bacterium]|nr:SDR family oxidoreductase [Dehalococcoidia bacterium]
MASRRQGLERAGRPGAALTHEGGDPVLETLELDGKAIVVTGGGRGLGRAMALALAEAGARVCVAARTQEQLDETVALIREAGGTATSVRTDVTDSKQVDALVEACVREYGQLDGMFANAGGGAGVDAEFWEYPDEAFEDVLAVNLKSAFYSGRAAAKQMVAHGNGGVIVNTSSGTAMRGNRGFAYPTAKGGVLSLTKSEATMLYGHGIRANVIVPGFVSQRPPKDEAEAAFRQQRGSFVPVRRLGEWWELGPLAVFLASEASRYVTGQEFIIDGGGLAGGVGPTGFAPQHEW